MSKALYSATLLEQGLVNENAWGRTWFPGERNTTPTLATIYPFGSVLDSPSKNSCHTSSLEVILTLITSSRISSCSFKDSGTWWAAKKSARVWPLIAFWGYEGHVILGQQYGPKLANLKFRKPGFVMRIRRGLNLEMTWMVCLTK